VVSLTAAHFRSTGETTVDGGRVLLPAPPPGTPIAVSAHATTDGQGRLELEWDEATARRLGNDGIRLPVEMRSKAVVRLVDERGDAVGGLEVGVHGSGLTGWTSDKDGRFEITGPPGSVDLVHRGGALARIELDGNAEERTVTVRGLRRIGGSWRLSPIPYPHFFGVVVLGGDEVRHAGAIDPEAGRWSAWVPFADGTKVKVRVERPIQFPYLADVEAVVGRGDVDLVVEAGALSIEPRMGTVARPWGTLRLRPRRLAGSPPERTAATGGTHEVQPSRPRATYSPLRLPVPGRDDLARPPGPDRCRDAARRAGRGLRRSLTAAACYRSP
jgi:hypothetical protein